MEESHSKDSIIEYLEKNHIKEILNQSINELLEYRPKDASGFLSTLLLKHCEAPSVYSLKSREILDSRGYPTVQVDVFVKYLDQIVFGGRAAAPSGTTIRPTEPKDLRDNVPARFFGKGVQNAIKMINETISQGLSGKELMNLSEIDAKIMEYDPSDLKDKIGALVTSSVSLAIASSIPRFMNDPLFVHLDKIYNSTASSKFIIPVPLCSVINGGKSYGSPLKISEVLIYPRSDILVPDQIRMISEVFNKLGVVMVKKYGNQSVCFGVEGGYYPSVSSIDDIIGTLEKAIVLAGHQPGKDVFIGINANASELYIPQTKVYEIEQGVNKSSEDLLNFWKNIMNQHPSIMYIEDPFDDNDLDSWSKLTAFAGQSKIIAGGDAYVSNPKAIIKGVQNKTSNGVVLKINQCATVTEMMKTSSLALDNGSSLIISDRSGDNNDSILADISVASRAKFLKSGSLTRSERNQKYNRLLQIFDWLRTNNMISL